MIHAPRAHQEIRSPREVIAYPRIDEFYNMLQFRLNMTVEDFTLQHKFTIFINALPRTKTTTIDRYENVDLIYGGIARQRILLEGEFEQQNRALDAAWNFLDAAELDSESANVSSKLYESFSRGAYRLEDIPKVGMASMLDYFEPILQPDKTTRAPSARQKAEFQILSYHFDLEKSHFFSIPLVLFGEIDGVLHFVYTDDDASNIKTRSLGSLIRIASAMYETQLLEWDLLGRNPEKSKAVLEPLDPNFYEHANKNPILRQLGFPKYYKNYIGFYQARIRFNDDIIHSKVYRPYLKSAIISIMIDSYAHNVSAHSLVALNWWFKKRAENLRQRGLEHDGDIDEVMDIVKEHIPEGFEQDRVVDLLSPWIQGLFIKNADPDYDLVKFPGPLAKEIQPLLKFLMQKGAFWSGIARDNHFGGESVKFSEMFWYNFINNPLYLGTIAKSEDIHRISIRVISYEPYKATSPNECNPSHKPKKVLIEGQYCVVDLKHRRPRLQKDSANQRFLPSVNGTPLYVNQFPELDDMSDFVMPGKDYEAIKDLLDNTQLFFPGEVVGRHAFFTLIENEIRNIKHYKGEVLREIQKNGLELCISIQNSPVQDNDAVGNALCRIGIWINAITPLILKDKSLLLEKKFASLRQDIMDAETFSPHLGGGFQDKICAGMLFNNRFNAVQNGDNNALRDQDEDTERDQLYYPWITPATSPPGDPHDDIEFGFQAYRQWEQFSDAYNHKSGYLKKYFHVWKAADIQKIDRLDHTDFVWENLARFRFICLQEALPDRNELFEVIRHQGAIRIINDNVNNNKNHCALSIINAYQSWFKQWFGHRRVSLQLRVDRATVGAFLYEPNGNTVFQYIPEWQLAQQAVDSFQENLVLDIAHGGDSTNPDLLRYRNHGVYKKYFQALLEPGKALSHAAQARMAEFFEILMTRVTIFDSRVYHRFRDEARKNNFEEKLYLTIRDEVAKNLGPKVHWLQSWEEEKDSLIKNSHFLVLHLSYIEKILLTKYRDHEDYSDENLGLFIMEEILPHLSVNGKVRDNFMLVITTGRGRTKWWTKLMENPVYQPYRRFTMFRPVESIISAIEDAISRKDDIELKYSIVKTMFGS